MFDNMNMPWTLAQVDQPPPPPPDQNAVETEPGTPPATEPGPGEQPQPGPWGFLIPMILLLVVFWVLLIMPQRRERKRKDQMLSALKKGDRVQTIGGVLGTVVEIRDHEVVVKVDESNNTRLHFAKAAVQAVLDRENGKPEGA